MRHDLNNEENFYAYIHGNLSSFLTITRCLVSLNWCSFCWVDADTDDEVDKILCSIEVHVFVVYLSSAQ